MFLADLDLTSGLAVHSPDRTMLPVVVNIGYLAFRILTTNFQMVAFLVGEFRPPFGKLKCSAMLNVMIKQPLRMLVQLPIITIMFRSGRMPIDRTGHRIYYLC